MKHRLQRLAVPTVFEPVDMLLRLGNGVLTLLQDLRIAHWPDVGAIRSGPVGFDPRV